MNNDDEPLDDLKQNPEKAFDLEQAYGALDELFLLARHYRNSGKFKDLLSFVASFRQYSAFNAMMVHIQMPGARYVLPAKRWLKQFGRRPTIDAQPLIMLQPMSPIMFGFDVSQTEGKDLPLGFADPFQPSGYLTKGIYEMLINNTNRLGISIKSKSLGSTFGGYVRNANDTAHIISIEIDNFEGQHQVSGPNNIPSVAEITLNSNLSDETNFATLTHELGHLFCGHLGSSDPKRWPNRPGLGRNICEFEAESVSYLVCTRAGLETPAAEYLFGYLGANLEVPAISLDVVVKAAQRIESMIKKKVTAISINN
jgi:hypothetical protein